MLQSHQVEQLMTVIAALDRQTLVEQFHNCQASFPVDFTPEFLANQPLERLRHIFVALCLQAHHMPALPAQCAA
jgi:hypothetical protein